MLESHSKMDSIEEALYACIAGFSILLAVRNIAFSIESFDDLE